VSTDRLREVLGLYAISLKKPTMRLTRRQFDLRTLTSCELLERVERCSTG
jgi:hypothetical protein